jgi:hypothetical protein
MVFSPIPFQPDDLLTKNEAPAAPEDAEPAESVPRASLVSTVAESLKQMLFPSCDVSFPNSLRSVLIDTVFSVLLPVQRKHWR